MIIKSLIALLLVSLLIPTQNIHAEDAKDPNAGKLKDGRAALDLSVPTSAAFSALGISPQTVIRPTSPRDLAASLINGVDSNGNLQNGIALEFSPGLTLFPDRDLTLDNYRVEPDRFSWTRTLYRTNVSLATTKGSSDDDKSVRFAFGVTITPFDTGDPRMDRLLSGCFLVKPKNQDYQDFLKENNLEQDYVKETDNQIQVLNEKITFLKNDIERIKTNPALTPDQKEKQLKPKREELAVKKTAFDAKNKKNQDIAEKLNKFCKAKGTERNWNASSWNIGVAPTFLSGTGRAKDMQWSGAAVWTSFAYGFNWLPFGLKISEGDSAFDSIRDVLRDNLQLIGHARYRANEKFPNPLVDGMVFGQDTFLVAAQGRLRGVHIQSPDNELPDLSFEFEVSYRHEDRKGLTNEEIFRYSGAAEYKLVDDVYLKFTLGTEDGGGAGQDQAFAIGDLKWGFSTQ